MSREHRSQKLRTNRPLPPQAHPRPARPRAPRRSKAALRLTTSWKHRLWRELHTRALLPLFDPSAERAWLNAFTRRIPCAGCRAHWKEIVRNLPPDLSSPANYFTWSVQAHNRVNVLLDKPLLTVPVAHRLWQRDATAA